MHGLAVLDFPDVLFASSVRDDAKAVGAGSLRSSLLVMFVEVDADFVWTQRGLFLPNDVFHRRVRDRSNVHINIQITAAIAFFVVEVDALTRWTKHVQVQIVVIVPCQRDLNHP